MRARDAPAHGRKGVPGVVVGSLQELATPALLELRREGLPRENKDPNTPSSGKWGGMRRSEDLLAHIMSTCLSWQAATPKAMGGLSDAAPKEEPGVLSQDAGWGMRSPAEAAASPIPARKEVAEEKEVAGTPDCEVRKPGASAGTAPGHSGWGPTGREYGRLGPPR